MLKLTELSHFWADFGPLKKMFLALKSEPLDQVRVILQDPIQCIYTSIPLPVYILTMKNTVVGYRPPGRGSQLISWHPGAALLGASGFLSHPAETCKKCKLKDMFYCLKRQDNVTVISNTSCSVLYVQNMLLTFFCTNFSSSLSLSKKIG